MNLTIYSKRLINECDKEFISVIRHAPKGHLQKFVPHLMNFVWKRLEENRKRIDRVVCRKAVSMGIEEKLECEKRLYRYFDRISYLSRLGV